MNRTSVNVLIKIEEHNKYHVNIETEDLKISEQFLKKKQIFQKPKIRRISRENSKVHRRSAFASETNVRVELDEYSRGIFRKSRDSRVFEAIELNKAAAGKWKVNVVAAGIKRD